MQFTSTEACRGTTRARETRLAAKRESEKRSRVEESQGQRETYRMAFRYSPVDDYSRCVQMILVNCFVENIETIALDSYFLKYKFWGRYMDDIISVWNYGVEELKSFLQHLNFWGGDLKFTTELEEDNKLPFLNVLLLKNENNLDFKIYRKPTNNNRFLSFFSSHASQVKIF